MLQEDCNAFACGYCVHSSRTKLDLVRHIREAHEDENVAEEDHASAGDVVDQRLHRCEPCQRSFR